MKSIRQFCQIFKKIEFSLQIFEESTQIRNYMTFCQVKVEFFHADRQTDGRIEKRNGVNSCFSQFSKVAKSKLLRVKLWYVYQEVYF
jgi:hypothetical protein